MWQKSLLSLMMQKKACNFLCYDDEEVGSLGKIGEIFEKYERSSKIDRKFVKWKITWFSKFSCTKINALIFPGSFWSAFCDRKTKMVSVVIFFSTSYKRITGPRCFLYRSFVPSTWSVSGEKFPSLCFCMVFNAHLFILESSLWWRQLKCIMRKWG